MRPSSAEVTSARHSSRPWRIRRNSSVPVPTTAPTVAVRAEITPSSGASTCVLRQPHLLRLQHARAAASTRAWAVFSAVRYWLICEALMRAGLLQRAGARGVAGGFGGVGLGFGQAGARLRHVGAHGLGGEGGQHLAALHPVAHVDPHFGQAQAAGFGADAGFLPGGEVAVGRQRDRQHAPACGVAVVTVSAGLARRSSSSSAALSPQPASSSASGQQRPARRRGGVRRQGGITLRFLVRRRAFRRRRARRSRRRPLPAAAERAVQRDPGGDALALQRDQRGLGGQQHAALVLQFDQAGQAAAVARLGGGEGGR